MVSPRCSYVQIRDRNFSSHHFPVPSCKVVCDARCRSCDGHIDTCANKRPTPLFLPCIALLYSHNKHNSSSFVLHTHTQSNLSSFIKQIFDALYFKHRLGQTTTIVLDPIIDIHAGAAFKCRWIFTQQLATCW